MAVLPSIFKTCVPRDEILSGELSFELFAAKLKMVVDGNAPKIYQQPDIFFANTYPTNGLKTLIREVFGRLVGSVVGLPSFGWKQVSVVVRLTMRLHSGILLKMDDRFRDSIALQMISPLCLRHLFK